MGDLDNSPLFDRRQIDFIGALLRGSPRNPINGPEQKFLENAVILREINDHMEGQLVANLTRYQTYVAVQVAVQFLIKARNLGMLEEAVQVLEVTNHDRVGGDLKHLMTILRKSKEMPTQWASPLYGEDVGDRHDKSRYENKSGLNLEAMRNFK